MADVTSPQLGKSKHLGGRPPKLTPIQKAEVLLAFDLYIQRTADPTIVGFCSWDPVPLMYYITDDDIDNWEEFNALRKRAVHKQEAFLIEAGGRGKYNPTMAIFRLKQPTHGYKDRIDTDITTGGDKIEVGMNATQLDQLIRARAERTDT
jgi:hypothetical protein